jgi:F0F1-type ATP synthase assembly protein I
MHQHDIETESKKSLAPAGVWLVHDMIIGLLAGTGVGSIAGLFVAARISDNNLFTLAGAIIGAILGILVLVRSHQRHDRFFTPVVFVMWFLLVASALFIAALISAIANFN